MPSRDLSKSAIKFVSVHNALGETGLCRAAGMFLHVTPLNIVVTPTLLSIWLFTYEKPVTGLSVPLI